MPGQRLSEFAVTTTIRREKHRPRWQRRWMPVALLLLALVVALLVTAWKMGGPVPVKPVAVALPSTTVGSTSTVAQSASSGRIGG
jgi:hypothetical protein